MENLPWPTITAASGGWVGFFLVSITVVRLIITGKLITSREADALVARAEKAESGRDILIKAIAETTGVGKLQKKFAEQAIADAQLEDGT